MSDAGLAHLANLSKLEDLDLSECSLVTDQGLAHLANKKELKKLSLWRVATDAGAAHCRLKNMEWLNVDNTQLTDAGLPHLAGMTQLAFLHLGQRRSPMRA